MRARKSTSRAEITFKSGAVVTFDCTKVSVSINGLGQRTGINWTTADEAVRRLVDADIDEVVAVVFVDGSR